MDWAKIKAFIIQNWDWLIIIVGFPLLLVFLFFLYKNQELTKIAQEVKNTNDQST